MIPLIFSIGIIPAISYDVKAAYIDKFSLPYVLDPLTDSQIKECESIYNDFISLSDSDFYTRYLNHTFAGNCVMLFEDPVWDYDGSDRYEKLSERSVELTHERETELKQRRENFYIQIKSVTELQIPGTFLLKFEGCSGDQTININDISVVSDKETVLLTKFVGEEREIPPGICNTFEVQIRADDPSSIRIMLPMAEIPVSAENLKEKPPASMKADVAMGLPTNISIRYVDLNRMHGALSENDFQECERVHDLYTSSSEHDFSARKLYHPFMGDCVLLFDDPIWQETGMDRYDRMNERLVELRDMEESERSDRMFKAINVNPRSITESQQEGVYIYSFEGCTGDKPLRIRDVVVASDLETKPLVKELQSGMVVSPGRCKVFDFTIKADDPESIRVMIPDHARQGMMMKGGMLIDHANMSPRAQMILGASIDNVICKEGLQLMEKTRGGMPACVSNHAVDKLVARGWGTPIN